MHSADFYLSAFVSEGIVYHLCGIFVILEELSFYARGPSS